VDHVTGGAAQLRQLAAGQGGIGDGPAAEQLRGPLQQRVTSRRVVVTGSAACSPGPQRSGTTTCAVAPSPRGARFCPIGTPVVTSPPPATVAVSAIRLSSPTFRMLELQPRAQLELTIRTLVTTADDGACHDGGCSFSGSGAR
jgi:hypothetical protein